MKKTPNLNLPIYDAPETDIFDVQEWNNANNSIDTAYKEIIDIKTEIPLLNADAESIRNANEEVRKSSEATRLLDEEARKSSEANRLLKEEARVRAEANRVAEEENRKREEATRVLNEDARKSKELTRLSDEEARRNAESSRLSEEQARKSEEATRQSSELIRISNEEARKGVEATRVIDEQARKNEEAVRQLKEQERLTAEATRVANELIRKKEIEEARKDFNGVTKESLAKRLSSDMNYVNDRFNKATLVEYDNKYVSASKSYDGITKELKIKGRTLQNLNGSNVGNGKINPIYYPVATSDLLKPSTKYTIIISNKTTEELSFYCNPNRFEFKTVKIPSSSILKFTNVTVSDFTGKGNIWLSVDISQKVTQNIDIVVLEGDYSNEDIPYFEGIKSVGEEGKLDVVSCGKNLLSGSIISGGYDATYGTANSPGDRVRNDKPIKVSGDVSITRTVATSVMYIYEYDINMNYLNKGNIKAIGINEFSKTYALFENTRYINISDKSNDINTIIQVEKNTSPTSYEPYKETRIPIILNTPLRSLPNGIKDELNLENGKIIRRIGKVVLNGSEVWSFHSSISGLTNHIAFTNTLVNRAIYEYGNLSDYYICDKMKTSSRYGDDYNINKTECIALSNNNNSETRSNYICIKILRSKLATQDINGLKQWLSQNPVTVYYQSEKPIEEPIVLSNNLRTYDNVTNIFTEGSLIEPNVYAKIPSDVIALTDIRNSTVKNKIFANADARVEELEQDVKNIVTQEEWITPTLLNGWTVYTGSSIGYKKIGAGVIFLKGRISGGELKTTFFILPVGYRPSQDISFPVITTTGVFGYVNVGKNGECNVWSGNPLSYVVLDSISFTTT